MQRPDPTTVSVETFGKLVGAAPGEVEGLLRAGTLKRAAPGRVPLIESVRAFITHTKMQAKDASAAAAQTDARQARAEASELSLAIQSREVIPDADAEAALQFICGSVLEALSGLPARISRDRAARAVIEGAIRVAQTSIADELGDLASVDRAGREVL